MFSNFGNINIQKPRQAETTDTRQGIRRHDPDQQQRKKKKSDSDNPIGFDEDDIATVSIEALQLFLQNFLKSTEVKADKPTTQNSEPPEAREFSAPQAPKPVSGVAAHAAHVYQHSAQAVRGNAFGAQNALETTTVAQSLGLDAAEVRTIHALLAALKTLSTRKVEYLRIERSDSFLHSLEKAVAGVMH